MKCYQDRYKELLRLSRQWRNLKLRRWAGYGHNTGKPITPGALGVVCPACPDPNTNLPSKWREDEKKYTELLSTLRHVADFWPGHRWKYMRSIVMDGNFSVQHWPMKNPEDDVPLADGHLFTVEDEPYKAHLETAKEFAEVIHIVLCFNQTPR